MWARSLIIMLIMVALFASVMPTLVQAATAPIYSQSFDSGSIPANWNDANSVIFPWAFNDPEHRGNLCGGTGGFATADRSVLLSINLGAHADLESPTVSLAGVNNAYLRFNSTEHHSGIMLGTPKAYVYMSVNGGTPQIIWQGSNFDAKTIIVPIPSSALGKNVMFDFVYSQPLLGLPDISYWQVDDLMVYTTNTAGQVQFDSSAYAVDETAGSVTVNVTRTDGNTGAVSVQYATSDGTAHAGTNYAATSGTLNFASGQTSATFSIPIKDDGAGNGAKAFSIKLSNPTGSLFIGSPNTTTVTVNDVPSTARPGMIQFDKSTYNTYYSSPECHADRRPCQRHRRNRNGQLCYEQRHGTIGHQLRGDERHTDVRPRRDESDHHRTIDQ